MFRRRRSNDTPTDADLTGDTQDDAQAPDPESAEAAALVEPVGVDRSHGPFDVSEVPDDGVSRLDLGGLRIPGVEGMELRLEVDEAADQVVAVSVVTADSALQITAFAAPRTDGIWDEVRAEIRGNLSGQGLVDEVTGEFGRELHASLAMQGPDGRTVMQPVRFVGIDGPRWFVRGLFSGSAARESAAAEPLEAVLRASVVVRGDDPMAPGDPLALHVPNEVPEGMSRRDDQAPEGRRTIPPPERGPEITEIR